MEVLVGESVAIGRLSVPIFGNPWRLCPASLPPLQAPPGNRLDIGHLRCPASLLLLLRQLSATLITLSAK